MILIILDHIMSLDIVVFPDHNDPASKMSVNDPKRTSIQADNLSIRSSGSTVGNHQFFASIWG